MTHRAQRFLIAVAATLLVVAAGCKRNSPPECSGHVAGDLVITEFMADPLGSDDGKEWFEIYNATSSPISLRGFAIYLAKSDGSNPRSHTMTEGEIPSKGYFVVGDAPATSKPDYVDYSYGKDLGSMSNTSGRIGIRCGTAVVDEVTYLGGGKSGHSRSLDGAVLPDSAANDQEGNWCDAQSPMAADHFGTPGLPNDACVSSANCIDPDTGQSRPVVSPSTGDVLITELLANPADIVDDTGEWVELYSRADVDLNGLIISSGSSKTTLASTTCLRVPAGTYAVLAKSADTIANGGLPTPLATITVTLANSASEVTLKSQTTIIDQIWYPAPVEGASSQLDPRMYDDQSNDNPLAFCPGTTPYGNGTQKGTPGQANIECPTAPDTSRCTENGEERDTIKPAPGDIVINELMPSPVGSASQQAWFELFVTREVDLNGLELTNGSKKNLFGPRECVRVAAGSYFVFARSATPYLNGGIQADATYGFDLASSGGTLRVLHDNEVLDAVSYLPPTKGKSIALDPGKQNPIDNDDPVSFCPGVSKYGNFDNLGTPGKANPPCPPPIDPTNCLDKGVSRPSVPPQVGGLVITEIMPSPSGTDAYQEWFEVFVVADADLNGLVISDDDEHTTTVSSEDCLRVTAGSYIVFGRSTDPTLNGGIIPLAGVFTFDLTSSGSVVLKHGSDVIDFALYASTCSCAKALQLDSRTIDADANDTPAAFCEATEPYGGEFGFTGNLGTPGLPNNECPPVIDPDNCIDSTGTERATIVPNVGDLVISEVMADPSKVGDAVGEWVEVYFKEPVDLNGVELVVGTKATGRYKILSTECIHPGAGGRVLLARSPDPLENGGLPGPVVGVFATDITNSGTTPISLVRNAQLIDIVSNPASRSGYSRQLSSNKMDATENDAPSAWCEPPATATYGLGDQGTPGAENVECLCASTNCASTTPCNPLNGQCECTATSCQPPETCDNVTKQCVYVDPNQCDDAGSPREIVPPAPGDLVISEYMSDPAAVGDTAGEWIEVYVKGEVDLNGVELSINTSKVSLTSGSGCVRPGAGSYVVLARSNVAADNGGLPAVLATFSAGLTNGGGQTISLSRGGTAIDSITTVSSSAGASKQLSSDKLDATLNDDSASWCNTATGTTYGAGDRGTPGEANGACP